MSIVHAQVEGQVNQKWKHADKGEGRGSSKCPKKYRTFIMDVPNALPQGLSEV